MAIVRLNTVDEPVDVTGTVDTRELNQAAWQVQSITVVTAGTPVQGPSVAVPHQVSTSILNPSTNGATDVLFVANSSANTAIPNSRVALRRGESLALNITNTDLVWVDSNNNNVVAKFIVEA